MPDGFTYDLTLNASPFIEATQQAGAAHKRLSDGNREGAKQSTQAFNEMALALRESFRQSAEQSRAAARQVALGWSEAVKEVDTAAAGARKRWGENTVIIEAEVGKQNKVVEESGRVARKAAEEKEKLGRSSRHAGLGVLELARAVEDAQYGFRGIINNVPQIVNHFTGSAGLAGAASFAAVGLSLLFTAFSKGKEEAKGYADDLAKAVFETGKAARAATNQAKEVNAVADSYDRLEASIRAVNEQHSREAAEVDRKAADALASNANQRAIDTAESRRSQAVIAGMKAGGAGEAVLEDAQHDLAKRDLQKKFERDQADLKTKKEADERKAALEGDKAGGLRFKSAGLGKDASNILDADTEKAMREELDHARKAKKQAGDEFVQASKAVAETKARLDEGRRGAQSIYPSQAEKSREELPELERKHREAKGWAEVPFSRYSAAAQTEKQLDERLTRSDNAKFSTGLDSAEKARAEKAKIDQAAEQAEREAAAAKARAKIIGGQIDTGKKVFDTENQAAEITHAARKTDIERKEGSQSAEQLRDKRDSEKTIADKAAAEKKQQMDSVQEEAKKRGIDTSKPGWGLKLAKGIQAGGSGSDDDNDDDDDERGSRGHMTKSGRRKIIGARFAKGAASGLGNRLSKETRDPRIANRGKPQADPQMSKGEQAILKTLGDLLREAKKTNSPKK